MHVSMLSFTRQMKQHLWALFAFKLGMMARQPISRLQMVSPKAMTTSLQRLMTLPALTAERLFSERSAQEPYQASTQRLPQLHRRPPHHLLKLEPHALHSLEEMILQNSQ